MTETLSQAQKFTILRQMTQRYPLKCKLFINLLLSNLPQGSQIQTPKDFKKAYSSFSQIFSRQTTEQKLSFIGQMTDHINTSLGNNKNGTTNILNSIQTSCEIKTSMIGINYWEKRTFKYDHEYHKIKLLSHKKQDLIDLKWYLVRKSCSEKEAMVLEATEKCVSDKMYKVTIKFKNSSIFREIYENIRSGIFQLLENKIQALIHEDIKDQKIEKMTENNRNTNGFNILTTKNMTQYFNNKQKLSQKLQKYRSSAFMISNKSNVKIYRSEVNKKCYYLEQTITQHQQLQQIKENIPFLASQTIKDKILMEVLEVFNKNITANYYKFDVGTKEYQFLVINQKNQKQGYLQQTMKAATDFFLNISIQFIIATLEKTSKSQLSFKMSLILNTHHKKGSKVNKDVLDLLIAMAHPDTQQTQQKRRGSFSNKNGLNDKGNLNIIDFRKLNKIGEQNNKSLNFNTVNGEEGNQISESGKKTSSESSNLEEELESDHESERFYSLIGDDEDDLKVFSSFDERKISIMRVEKEIPMAIENTEPTVTQDLTYLKIKAFNEPLPPTELKILTEHFLFGEWRRSSKGGVVCANEEVIKEQKRILKLVFTRIGSNIFKGNHCMNVSLPIQLFRKESFLVCIGNNLTYAPLTIEPSVSFQPVERMKHLAIFEISLNVLALSTRKPFNPILGQTYQGEIAGCPVFMEQISHHPPITSIYMVGRGYKIYGTMQIDVNLRLNYVRGVNHCNMTIQYDNGSKITFDLPQMLVNGLILGQRSIYWEGPIHIIDHDNLLIAQITYNAINLKKGMFSLKTQSPDYLSGQIYQVSSSFLQRFIQSKKKLSIKKDQKTQVLSKIHGEWNGKIFIDNNLFYDFQKQLPVELQNYSCPLPSDSFLRADVEQMIKDDLNAAQDEKDRLQQIQRKDKKLRTANSKNMKKK